MDFCEIIAYIIMYVLLIHYSFALSEKSFLR